MRNENIINLKRNSLIILLTSDIKKKRLSAKEQSAEDYCYSDELKGLLPERELKHEKSADYIIDTSSLSPEEVCDLIMHYAGTEVQ